MILCVGSEAVEAQLTLCANLGVRAVVLFASGYAELGAQGQVEQQRLVDICRRGGMRLLGPNSIGVASFDSGAVLSFASIYADCEPKDGPVAIVSQSGAFGVSVYALLREAGVGVRCVAATGNEADLDTADFVAALAQRPGVRLILLYLENVGDPRRMRAALQTARQRGVCVVAVRAGRSADGLPLGRSAHRLRRRRQRCAGCLVRRRRLPHRCRHGRDAALRAGLPAGRATLHRAGSAAAGRSSATPARPASSPPTRPAAPACPLAHCPPASQARLGELLPDFSLNRNPIDLTAMLLAKPSLLGDVMQCVMADPAADCVVLGLLAIGGPSYDVERFARDCRAAARASGKPLWVYSPHPRVRQAFSDQGLPVFAGEAEALREIVGHAGHLRALRPSAIAEFRSRDLACLTQPSSPTPARPSARPFAAPST